MSAPPGGVSEDRLDSWKEIATFLGREVRTVQGWEKSEGLPVHRHQHSRQGTVYAFRSELDAWREARKPATDAAEVAPPETPTHHKRPIRLITIAAGIVLVAASAVLIWTSRRAKPLSESLSSVVVLPFVDFSQQKDQEYFSDGLTEEIIDALSRVPNLRVVARTSAFTFKGKPVDIREIGKQLNVAAVLEGSVRKSGDQLRITAQLNRVSDGTHLWSRTYDRPLRDIFAIQRDISQSIADQLRAGQIPERGRTHDLEAYRLYQEGRYFFNLFQPPDSNLKAIERYLQAIQRDPNFALAYSGMADAYAYLGENFVMPPREVMPKAKAAAEKAVALDDSSAEAHTSLGTVKLDYDRDREGAQRELQRALQLNPGSGYARHWYAHSLESQGKLEEAMREMRTARDLDPLSIPISWDIAAELMEANRLDEALQELKRDKELFPGIPIFPYMQAAAEWRKGDPDAAHRALEALSSAQPDLLKDPTFLALFGVDAARQGHPAKARETLDRIEMLRNSQYVEPVMVLELCAELQDVPAFRLWLKRADEDRSTFFVYLPLLKDFYGFGPPYAELLVNTARQ
jgi:TolB-like protein/Flp pilus assembly protein TadD